MKKVFIIARQTVIGFARDRVFHSVLIFSVLFVLFSYLLSTLTIVESRKILMDFGLSAISFMGIVLSVFMGVTVVAGEIEKRTVYTILSKALTREQYLLGKFLGAALVAIVVHVLNALTLILILFYLGEGLPQGMFASVYLMILESILILSLALAISLYSSSMFLSACLTAAVFLVGRSNETLRHIQEKTKSEVAKLLLSGFHNVFPSLDRFNIREVVAYGKPYPKEILGTSSLYFAAYVVMLLVLATLIIRRKDMV